MPHPLPIVIIATLCLALTTNAQEPAKQPDALATRLIQAKEDFRKACEMADRELLLAIEAEVQSAQSDGNFDRAKKLMKIKEDCQTAGLLPTDESVIRARVEYDRQFQEAKANCLEEFARVVAEHTKNGEMARAEKAKAEERKWLEFVKARKTPTTRFGMSPEQITATPWNGHRYKVFKEPCSWHEAKKKCEAMGGCLVVIGNEEEQNALLKLLGQSGIPVNKNGENWDMVWIGATDEAKEGQWMWVDDTPVVYQKWFVKRPNNSQGASHYAGILIHRDGRWSDAPESKYPFICEWDE